MGDDAVRYLALALLACYPDASDPRWSLVRELAGVEDEGEVMAPRRAAYHDGDAWKRAVGRLYAVASDKAKIAQNRDAMIRALVVSRGVVSLHELGPDEVRELADEIVSTDKRALVRATIDHHAKEERVGAEWCAEAWRKDWSVLLQHLDRVGLDADEARAAMHGGDPWRAAIWTQHRVRAMISEAASWDEAAARAWLAGVARRQGEAASKLRGVFDEEVRRG